MTNMCTVHKTIDGNRQVQNNRLLTRYGLDERNQNSNGITLFLNKMQIRSEFIAAFLLETDLTSL